MVLSKEMGDFKDFMNMPVLELLDLCADYNELNREIQKKMREEMKRR